MPDAMLEDLLRGAVVDGQLHADLFNGDVAHNAGAGHIQRAFVGGKALREIQRIRVCGDLCIEIVGGVKVGAVIRIGHGVHVLRVACHSTGLMQLVDVIAEGGV